MNIEAVIFDLDGTIVKTEQIIWDIWFELGEKHNITIKKEMLEKVTGSDPHKEQQIVQDYPEFFILADLVSETFVNRLNEMKVNGGDVSIAGLYELMDYFQQRGIPMAIASNSDKEHVTKLVSMLKNNHLFEIVMTRDDVTIGKPNPEMFLKVADFFQVEPEKVLVIEDSKFGIKAAKAAQMRRILIRTMMPISEETKEETEYICDSLLEVIDVLENGKTVIE